MIRSNSTPESRIEAIVTQLGGSSPKIHWVESAGIVGVRFCNSIGLMETRWGTSLHDLEKRLNAYATRIARH